MDPTLSPRRLKLRLLICNPKSYGPKNITVKGRTSNGGTARTREDPYLPSVFTYECKTAEEWQMLTTGISKQISNQNSFHAYAHFVDAALPPGPTGRVMCEAGGVYENAEWQRPDPKTPYVIGVDMGAPTTHEERVLCEKAELNHRLCKLQLFITKNPIYQTLPVKDQELMMDQLKAMREYSIALERRAARFSKSQEGSTPPPTTIYPGMIPATDDQGAIRGMVGIRDMTEGYGILAKSDPVVQRPVAPIPGQTFEIISPTGEDSQSGSVGEALVESEPTLSEDKDEETLRQGEGETPIPAPEVIDSPEPAATPKPKPPAKKAAGKKK